jgi:hypothetical protein
VPFLSMTSRRLKPVRRRGPTIIHRTILCVVVTVACAVPTLAQFEQEGEVGYHSIACIKVKPEKASEFRAWAASDFHKYAQSMVDTGVLSGWFLARSVQPQGTSAECDYLAFSMYPTTPPEPLNPEALDEVAGGPPFQFRTNHKSSGAPSFAHLRRVGCKLSTQPCPPA